MDPGISMDYQQISAFFNHVFLIFELLKEAKEELIRRVAIFLSLRVFLVFMIWVFLCFVIAENNVPLVKEKTGRGNSENHMEGVSDFRG